MKKYIINLLIISLLNPIFYSFSFYSLHASEEDNEIEISAKSSAIDFDPCAVYSLIEQLMRLQHDMQNLTFFDFTEPSTEPTFDSLLMQTYKIKSKVDAFCLRFRYLSSLFTSKINSHIEKIVGTLQDLSNSYEHLASGIDCYLESKKTVYKARAEIEYLILNLNTQLQDFILYITPTIHDQKFHLLDEDRENLVALAKQLFAIDVMKYQMLMGQIKKLGIDELNGKDVCDHIVTDNPITKAMLLYHMIIAIDHVR